ncbi:sodium:calcium antiporter [Deferribacterales bacterium Es71-Z0220]|uniref:sodium:calcium antiporter n=1 Tax=Deferrivibrio essentukiensis TaxID=2880922 RepID=UPI001F603C49|nr:sodium:calcium antiporter [Deferrivibrio essentukiensis]MCB4203660.1 sodium:calcium antiporter [Deferrivibrio essentukiensis]
MYFALFAISAFLVIFSGIKLSKYGDVIASKTPLGHSFVGVTFLALFTSLPELISSIGAVTIVDAPDLVFGNVYGSNMFNILIIFFLDALFKKDSVFKSVSLSNIVTASFAILLPLISAFGFLLNIKLFGVISGISLAIFIIYILSMYSAYRTIDMSDSEIEDEGMEISLNRAVFMFMFMASIIVFAGLLLSKSADEIAAVTGLGRTVVGSFLLALVTSLPEVSACVGAIKVGSPNMAIGNLFGSNVFNITIIPIADIFYKKGDIFTAASKINLIAAISSAIIVLIAVLGIQQDKLSKFRFGHISLYSVYILLFYVVYSTIIVRG